MSSDLESSHQITVPVFIEPAPPENRFFTVGDPSAEPMLSEFWRDRAEAFPHPPRLQHQETLHTDSGLDTEDICPATPTGGRFSVLSPGSPGTGKRPGDAGIDKDDENLRMVLV